MARTWPHNVNHYDMHPSTPPPPNIIRVIKSRRVGWAGHVACRGEERDAYRVLMGKLEENRPLGQPTRRSEDNIKMNLAQNRYRWRDFVNSVMNLRDPRYAANFLTNRGTVRSPRRTLRHEFSHHMNVKVRLLRIKSCSDTRTSSY